MAVEPHDGIGYNINGIRNVSIDPYYLLLRNLNCLTRQYSADSSTTL